MTIVRLATLEDIDTLIQMRWDFSEEDYGVSTVRFEEFNLICRKFLMTVFVKLKLSH